jgi:hypothetical protein
MPASHLNRTMATDAEIEAFRKDYAQEIGHHQKVVGIMKRHGVQMCRTEPEGAFDMRYAFDDFSPRAPGGGADPRPTSATDRGRRPARDQQQPPTNGTRPATTSKPLFDGDPQELLARLKSKLGDDGFQRLKSLLLDDDTTTDQLPKPVMVKPETGGQDQDDDEDQDNLDDDDNGNNNGASKLSGKLMSKVLALAAPHLSAEDQSELEMLLRDLCGSDHVGAQDDPPPFPGRPQTGGGMDPMKAPNGARNGKAPTPAMDCGLGRIKVDNLGVQASPYRPRPQPRPTNKQMAMDSANRQSFAARNPEVARIKVL